MLDCPVQDDSYKKLEGFVGKYAALRQWVKHRKTGLADVQATDAALAMFDVKQNKLEDKLQLLIKNASQVHPEPGHKYRIGDSILQSVSNRLDQIPETAYHGDSIGQEFAESGTSVHTVASLIANGVSEESVKQTIRDYELPQNVYDQLKGFIDKLRETGIVVSENVMADSSSGTAGTADIIHLKYDGTIDLYDFKTAYWTPALRRGNLNPWSKERFLSGHKALRYTTQLESYNRLIENIVGQPVSNQYLIPLEVSYKNDDPAEGIAKVSLNPVIDIRQYDKTEQAVDLADQIFGQKSRTAVTGSIVNPESHDTSDFFQKLTGQIQGVTTNAEAEASLVARVTQRGIKGYKIGGTFRAFRNQTDERAQMQQIIDEFVSVRANNLLNMEYSITNWLQSGNDATLDMSPTQARDLKTILSTFRGRDVQVFNLSRLKGFEKKTGWIVLQEDDTWNLLYIGTDNLRQPFTTRGIGYNNLFGNIMNTYDAQTLLESNLENTLGDAKKLEGSMIAMKIKEAFPNVRFDVTMVYSVFDGGPYSSYFSLKDGLNTIRLMGRNPRLQKILPEDISRLSTDPDMTDYSRYQQDFGAMILNYTAQMKEHGIRDTLVKGIRNYAADASNKQFLLAQLATEIDKRREIGKDTESDYETRLLASLYFQLQKVYIDLKPITQMSNLFSMAQNQGNQILQHVNVTVNNAINSLKNRFWDEYKKPFITAQKKLFKSQAVPLLSWTRDKTLGDTSRYYTDLFETRTFKVLGDSSVSEITVPTFDLITEGSDKFKQLSESQQNMITLINDTIEKFSAENNISWVRGRLPLVKGETSNLLFNALSRGDMKSYQTILDRFMSNLEDNFGAGDSRNVTSRNIFHGQQNTPENDSRRQYMMGITADGYIDLHKYREYSTNLEVIMDVFTIQSLRYSAFNQASVAFKAADTMFQWGKSNLMIERLGINMEFDKWFHEYTVNNRDIDSGTVFNKAARGLQRLASLTLIGGNPGTAAVSYIGQELSIFSEALSSTLASLKGDTGTFNTKDYMKAKGITNLALVKMAVDSSDYDKIDLLLQRWRLFDQDITSLLNGVHRYGDKTIFHSKTWYGMMRAGDWASRAHIMIAQMLHDGTWDAYSLDEDGELVYDQSKDKRFGVASRYTPEEQRALQRYLRNSLGIAEDEPLTDAYDDNMGNAIRGMANYLIGGFDREARAGYNARAWGKLFGLFKNWLPAKLDRWLKRPQENTMLGHLVFEKGQDGTLQPVWKGEQMEGIVFSILAGLNWINKTIQGMNNPEALAERKALTGRQRQNITKAATDLLLAGFCYLFYTQFPDGDDDTVYDDYSALIVRRSMDDLLVMYNLIAADDFFWTPMALQYLAQTYEGVAEGILGAHPRELFKITPIVRQLDYYYELIQKDGDI